MPPDPNNSPTPRPSLRSEFAGDPDMQEILVLFVQEMPERVTQMQEAWDQGHFDAVKRLAHQLKGAGGGYGFPSLGVEAAKLESGLTTLLSRADNSTELEHIRLQLDALVDLCNRVSAS